MDLLITGANGFLGAQIATQWLRQNPDARVGCLVRAATPSAARTRLYEALCQSAADQGIGDIEPQLGRVEPICGDMTDPAWIAHARSWLRGPAELVHCAANLSFREADRAAVWRTNVDGTQALLRGLRQMPAVASFNYVSTAYVAGDRQGDIFENETDRPLHFNNPYEESKWTAEAMVREACAASGVRWRIFRPSIIIAHSVTHRMSSQSGFYQVAETMMQLARQARVGAAGPIALPVADGTTLDLIPVDVVVREMLAVIAIGAASGNQTFHVTGATSLPLADVLTELSPMSGLVLNAQGPDTPISPLGAFVMRRLRYYMPYFSVARRFDRSNTRSAIDTPPYPIEVAELAQFVRSFMAQHLTPEPLSYA